MIIAYLTEFDYATGWIGTVILIAAFIVAVSIIVIIVNLIMVCLGCTSNDQRNRYGAVEHDVDDMILYDMSQHDSCDKIGKW